MFEQIENPVGSEGERVTIDFRASHLFVFTIITFSLVGTLAFFEGRGLSVPLLRELLAIVFLTFVPGTFVLLLFDYQARTFTTAVCYAFGLSIFIVMAVGGVTSVILPVLGITEPFSLAVLSGTWLVLTAVMTWTSRSRLRFSFELDRLQDPRVPALLLLPTTSVLGSVFYEVTGNNVLLLVLLVSAALFPVLAVALDDETWYFPLAIWCLSLALLYHGRVPGQYTVTQPTPQLALEQLRWIPNYGGLGSLLANGALFPVYSIFTGLSIELEWNLVNPIIVAFLPVALYETFRRYFTPQEALISACLFAFAYPFYVLYPTAGRAATPVIFIALLGVAYSDDTLPDIVQRLFVLLFGIGVATTHYGTAYVVMLSLIVGAMAFATLRFFVKLDMPSRVPGLGSVRADGGSMYLSEGRAIKTPVLLRPGYIAFYTAFALSWYLLTANSVKFVILPKKVVAAIQGILYVEATGSAVSSYQQNYVAVAIVVAQYFYILFGLLMIVGVGMAVLRLVLTHEESVDTGYLAVAIGFFSMFVGSALPSGNAFAVARVMMIIFTFAIPFVVVGAREIGGSLDWLFGRVSDTSFPWSLGHLSRASIAVVVAVFLLLNSGAVSETLTNDVAPSNRISEERLLDSDNPDLRLRATACTQCNVQQHVWVGSQVPGNGTVFVDTETDNQRDYYRGTLARQGALGLRYAAIQYNQTDVPTGTYLLVQDRNQDLGGFAIGYKYWFYEKNMTTYTNGNKLYSTGYGAVYREIPDGTPAFRRNVSTANT